MATMMLSDDTLTLTASAPLARSTAEPWFCIRYQVPVCQCLKFN
jgi:hypothetical protein